MLNNSMYDNKVTFKDGDVDDINVKEGSIVFVTIGVPFSNIPIMQKVMIYVEPTTDTPVTAAKKLRKQVADNIEDHGWVAGTNFKPTELYYEVFKSVENTIPFACSANAPAANLAC